MGCSIESTLCCKKKKTQKNGTTKPKRNTKFVAESFQHLKIEIKNNNNSNSKDIPLINNFFKETLGKANENANKIININEENKNNKNNKEIANIINENIYKGNNDKTIENNDIKSKNSSKNNSEQMNNSDQKIVNEIISEPKETNRDSKIKVKNSGSKDINKSNSKELIKLSKESKLTDTNRQNDSIKQIKENDLNRPNNNKEITNSNRSKEKIIISPTKKESSQIFVDYKTFIKGKPYSEILKEYKQGIEIGEGGFGKVKTIIHKKTGQLRAVKIIKKTKEFKLDEIENLMLLNHPNILKIFEYYYDEKKNIYIIMEYIRGEELFNKIQEVGQFSEVDAAIITKSILQAITYCHLRKIIHRDLKPENILVPTGSSKMDYTLLKIIDFGASILKKDDGKISFRFGTPYYIAPEVLQESYNEKCDVWSIGVIAYLLLTGQAPFEGEDDNIICQKIISQEIDYENNPKIQALSPEAVDFLKKLLEKNPDKRNSAAQALEHPWIKKFAPHTKVNKAFSKKIYKNLANFREKSQLSTAVVTFITNYLMNEDELRLLKKLFFELDVKGVGVITKEELYKGMEECFGNKITREEVNQTFSNIDYDNNGSISFDEFLKAAIDKKKILTEEKLRAAFSLFDRNGDGDIEAKELKEVIGDENNTGDNIWLKMIEEVDLDGNGVIDFDEFKTMMKKLCA